MYNAIALLNRIFNDALGHIGIPFMASAVCSMLVVSIYGTTRLNQSKHTLDFFVFPLATVVFSLQIGLATLILAKDYKLSTQFERNSLRALGFSCQMQSNQASYQRLVKSRKELRIELLGGTYYVKPGTKITLFKAIIDGSIYLLVTF